jgi:hypothetical protein
MKSKLGYTDLNTAASNAAKKQLEILGQLPLDKSHLADQYANEQVVRFAASLLGAYKDHSKTGVLLDPVAEMVKTLESIVKPSMGNLDGLIDD